MEKNPILLFDGVCNLCDASVQFVIRHDKKGWFRFAALQSEYAQELLAGYSVDPQALDSVILIYDRNIYQRSAAALTAARLLGGFWMLLYIFMVIPRPIRDFVYNWISKNRYHWFGKKDACMLPSPALKARFLG